MIEPVIVPLALITVAGICVSVFLEIQRRRMIRKINELVDGLNETCDHLEAEIKTTAKWRAWADRTEARLAAIETWRRAP